jgi:hypothetical protein
MVQAAVIPTSVFPAPQGSTMIPDLARLKVGQDSMTRNSAVSSQSLPVPEHLAQRSFLVRSNDGHRFEIYLKILIDIVCSEIILFQDGETDILALLLDGLIG